MSQPAAPRPGAARSARCGTAPALSGLLAALLAAAPAAAETPAAEQPRAEARLSAGWAEADGARVAGLSIALAPGWKTYWRAPGASGIPPAFDWTASDNLAAVAVEWPSPSAFDSFGVTTLGYADAVTLPLRLTPQDPGQPIRLRLAMDYGVCAHICVPVHAQLALDIAPDAAPQGAAPIAAALADLPADAAAAGVSAQTCALRGAGPARAFEARLTLDRPLAATPVAVVEGPEGVWFAPAEASLSQGGRALDIRSEAMLADPAAWVARSALRVTLVGPDGAVQMDGCGG